MNKKNKRMDRDEIPWRIWVICFVSLFDSLYNHLLTDRMMIMTRTRSMMMMMLRTFCWIFIWM